MAQNKPFAQPEPVRLYSEDDARLPRYLGKVLQEKIDAVSAVILTGNLSDVDYHKFTGRLGGLREALSECERIGTEISGS